MSLNYHKAKPTTLGDAGLDERWLQERILEDPTLLGLGDVSVVQRERKQSRWPDRLPHVRSRDEHDVRSRGHARTGR